MRTISVSIFRIAMVQTALPEEPGAAVLHAGIRAGARGKPRAYRDYGRWKHEDKTKTGNRVDG